MTSAGYVPAQTSRPPSQGGGSASPSHSFVPISVGTRTAVSSSNHPNSFDGPNMIYMATGPGSSPNSYQLYQQPQPSPNPSVASYSSSVPSPGQTGQFHAPLEVNSNTIASSNKSNKNQFGPTAELPNEVMERFDSLDIDSSELIPDLEFNSNTMLNLMMDTSSGLSLSDSFSDITNGNGTDQVKLTKSYNNGDLHNSNNVRSRSKLKLQIGGSNPSLMNQASSTNHNAQLLETPTIEMSNNASYGSCGFGEGGAVGSNIQSIDPLLSVLDLDNNNIIN